MLAAISSSAGYNSIYFSGKREGGQGGEQEKSASNELTEEEKRRVAELQQEDQRVRAHEQMHLAAGRDLITSGPSYGYEQGPDGNRYAVSGEVGIDTSPAETPEATLPKAQRIRAAALAPSDPSAQDRQVAAMASQMGMEAAQEIRLQKAENQSESGERSEDASAAVSETPRATSGVSAYRRMQEEGAGETGLSIYA